MPTPGLIVAPLTPFTADLTVDEAALRRQIDYVIDDCRATMVVAAGVETQEYTYLGFEQRKALIHRTIEFVDGRVPVMVGISHPSFKTAIELAHDAERHGAAAVQLLAPLRPFAGPPTQADLIAYFEAIGRESRLPITLYLNPGPGADVSVADTIALAKLPNVQLIKESSRDLARVARLIVEIDRAGHARYFTTMQMLLATLQLGGSGATMPPPGCEIARHVIDAFVAKDFERAAEIQLQFALFPSKWMHRGLAPAMKAALNLDRHSGRRALSAIYRPDARGDGSARGDAADDRAGAPLQGHGGGVECLFSRGQSDHRRHAAVRGAFVHLALFFDDLDVAVIAKGLLQHGASIEVLDLLRPAGTELQLLGRVALHDQQPAGFQRPPHAGPFPRALGRRAELREDFNDHVERIGWITPGVHVGMQQCDLHAAFFGQRRGFGLRGFREIDRDDVEALLGEPYSVAGFAVGDGQNLARLRQQCLAGRQKVVRRLAEQVFGRAVTALPTRIFARFHPRSLDCNG